MDPCLSHITCPLQCRVSRYKATLKAPLLQHLFQQVRAMHALEAAHPRHHPNLEAFRAGRACVWYTLKAVLTRFVGLHASPEGQTSSQLYEHPLWSSNRVSGRTMS